MKLAMILASALALYALSCWGQTNTTTEAAPRFFIPPVQLRLEAQPDPAKAASAGSLSLEPSPPQPAPAPAVALNASLAEGGFHSSVIRSDRFYLTRAEPLDSGMARVVDRIFTPEVVHIGKIPISASIITAIKRKNPLCLLNPIVFQASW